MGQGDVDVATPLYHPGQTRVRGPGQGLASDSGEDDYGNGNGNGEDNEDRSDFNNKSFLEDATLSSCSGSLSQHFHHDHYYHRHHYHHLRQYSETAIGNQTKVLQVYAYATANANMSAQSCAQQLPRRPSTAFASSTGKPKNLVGESFLLSRQTSTATMPRATSSDGGAVAAASTVHPLPLLSFKSAWCQEPKVDLRQPLESEHEPDRHQGLLDTLNRDHLRPDRRIFAFQDRPISSRSHVLHWRLSQNPIPDDWRASMGGSANLPSLDGNQPSMVITKEEFDTLPPTIQRKYFSIIERSLLAHQDLDDHFRLVSAGHDELYLQEPAPDKSTKHRRQHKTKATPEPAETTRRPRINSADRRFFESLPEKIKRQHLTEEEQIAARYRRLTLLHGPPKEQFTVTKRQQRNLNMMQSPLGSPALSDGHSSLSSMPHPHEDHIPHEPEKKGPDSFYDSVRWLEEEDSLDLRLYLDDYHINLREEIPVPKTRRPSFRRHLSINKLPFGRGSISYSRPPPVMETPRSPSVASSYMSNPAGSESRPRRRSRALSLMSANLQAAQSPTPMFDPCASHYQDPDARMKVRAFLASSQKFDEALEFGFPSVDGTKGPEARPVQGRVEMESSNKLRSFLEDDRSSTSSEEASIADPETPKTPQLCAAPERPPKTIMERAHNIGIGASRNPMASREMTLRMTLTRPDLRANEEQMYGWKRSSRQQDTSVDSPVIYARGENRKESIERQLAALDEWNDEVEVENGMVKRIWNRVRRS